MKVLIIGSEGFIGKSLSIFYRNNGNEVSGIDLINKTEPNYFCITENNFSFKLFFAQQIFDVCINASGTSSVNYSLSEPEYDYNLNVVNVFELLNAIRQFLPQCKFVQLSSAAVYGNPLGLPVTEEESMKPISPYGFHKFYSELLCKEFSEMYGVQSAIVRIFSAYGVGLKKQLFWDIYKKTLTNKKLILFGTGKESRDFIFIDDLAIAIDCVIKNGIFQSEIYNVANGEEIFINDAVACFLKKINWNGDISFSGEHRHGDPLNWRADITKLKTLGYKQKINFETGIDKYCKWLEELK